MKGRRITVKDIAGFREHLLLEERSSATVQKYIRDVKAFTQYASEAITKETVIAYKKHVQEHYAVRSVNSMLASINSLFAFLGWHDLRVKALKLQQQVYCSEEKELTKAEYTRLCRAAEHSFIFAAHDKQRNTERSPAYKKSLQSKNSDSEGFVHNETALTNLVFLLPLGNKIPRYPSEIFGFADGSGSYWQG